MPLLIEGKTEQSCFRSFTDFAEKHPHFKDIADEFCKKPVQTVERRGLLYITQGEYATVTKEDENVTVMGTEDATTCHMVVLRHTGSGVTSLGHFDGHDTSNGLKNMIASVMCSSKANGAKIVLHLFGGFLDDSNTSDRLTTSILEVIQNQDEPIHLSSACITGFNDTLDKGLHQPRTYGIGVAVQGGEIFPAAFADKGPDEHIRHARNFSGFGRMVEIYSSTYKELRILPYGLKSTGIIPYIPFFLDASDEVILEHLSTSPHCEPPDFVANIKATLHHILTHQQPLVTVFPGGRPRVYKRQPGSDCWIHVDT